MTASKTKITNLNIKYISKITKLYVDSVQKHFKGTILDEELKYWTYENEEKEFEKNLLSQNLYIRIMIDEANNLIGFTRFGADEDNKELGWIDLIFVNDKFHNLGYGKLLLEDAFLELKELGFDKVHLWSPTLGQSHGFYLKQKGKITGQKINEIGFNLTEYSWDIN